MTRPFFFRPLASSIIGFTLMLPASFFFLTLLARILFGVKAAYYYIAPSFLQSPLDLFSFHKAQLIIISLVLAVLFNVLTIVRLQLERSDRGIEINISYKRYWLNTAVVLQGVLFLLTLIVYTAIQHIRY
jgi:hypothetical protein